MKIPIILVLILFSGYVASLTVDCRGACTTMDSGKSCKITGTCTAKFNGVCNTLYNSSGRIIHGPAFFPGEWYGFLSTGVGKGWINKVPVTCPF